MLTLSEARSSLINCKILKTLQKKQKHCKSERREASLICVTFAKWKSLLIEFSVEGTYCFKFVMREIRQGFISLHLDFEDLN